MKKHFYLIALLVALFTTQVAVAQAPVATPEAAVTALLNRIGGNGAAGKFEIVIDANLAENGKDVFIITSQNGKPCIKGNTQLSVATGINWYLNHYAHINLTWNNLTTDLSAVTLPVPASEEKHVSSAKYRYDFNTCTFSYSMAFWTWERWQQEIDWMALHGINAPLNLVGLDVVTRNFLQELGVSESDIDAYIAGPGFIAWFAMNNLEGWGGTINSSSTGVQMNGNPDWWYTRQEQLCKNMLQRMRELGMQPVIPGFSGQVPQALSKYTISDFSSGDVVNVGSWASNFPHPGVVNPSTISYKTLATIYYKHLHDVMGVSEFYSIDPFHEMTAPVVASVLYPNIMSHLDRCYALEGEEEIAKFNAPSQPKWIIQQWQGTPVSGAFSAMSSYGDRFIGLDLFADAPGKAQWNGSYYQGRPYIFCMLHNFGGRSGLHGRLESVMNDYFRALAKNNNCQGIGATPEGSETNPILYDMLFELPWMDTDATKRPTIDKWLEDYAYSRYGVSATKAPNALAALQNLKKSVWACPTDQQGTSEAVILARPDWTINKVSSWSTAAIYWDTQDVRLAADQLISVADLVTANGGASGVANYNCDAIDVIRQAMVDYAAELLPLIKVAYDSKNTDEYTRLYQLYLQLMLDLDTMLSYDANFKLERWTSLARNIADEVTGTTDNDRNWLEWNARTQVTVWANQDCALHDYSNRCWAGLIKDFHYWRWKYFFEHNGVAPSGGWYNGFEYPWTVDFNNVYSYAGDYSQIVIPTDMSATAKAAETFGKYFGRVKGATKNYIFPMGVETNATKSDVIPEVYRGQTVELPLTIGKEVTVSSVQIDLNGDGVIGTGETLAATDMSVAIPADAAIGKTKAIVTFSDGTVITFNLAIIVDITADRTVTAATADANMGTVAIEGTNELTITNQEVVKIIATANTGYNFKNWTDAQGNVVSNDNPYIYYGEGDANFTANFIQDKWGVVECNGTLSGDIASYKQFIHNLTFAYYNREAETILEATTAPTQIFNTIPQIIDVPQGASFTVKYDNGSSSGLQYCYFRAYIDLNADGDFDDEGELLKEVGTNGAQNTAVCSNTMNVLLPYDMPLGITHMRLRFDGAWDNSNNPSGRGAKDSSIRPVYEIVLNITEGSDKAAHVTVKLNSNDWGTVRVQTDEVPADIIATEWDVTRGVEFSIVATPATAAEFLGWYDHYGRLLTTELEYKMLAKEDATYTARFRKFLEIDGWQMEYRTEPGTEIKYYSTTALANGVKPVGGKKYYIAAHTLSGGSYYNRYLYDNNGTLATSTAVPANCVWTCIDNGNGTFSFQNESGKYLANNNNYHISIGTTAAKYEFTDPKHEGVTLKNAASYDGGKCMVTSHDGTAFNRNDGIRNDGQWSSDYLFYEGIAPDNVILTNVRKSGDHDLEIPETVEILGEQCTITGFDNGLFANNKDLWSISLPATIETMSNNRVFKAAIPGKGANASADSKNYIVTNLGTTCAPGEDWSISMTIEDNGNNFNQWGSALIATGSAPMNSTYATGFQLYMQAGGGLVVKTDVDGDGNKLTNLAKNSSYRIDIVYTHSNTKLVVTATPLASQASLAAARRANATRAASSSLEITQDMSGFSTVSHAIPEGVNITNLEVNKGTAPDPFEGCTNLVDMTVAAENENYYVDSNTRTLYTTGGTDLHTLADEDKEVKLLALSELSDLIDLTKALIDEVTVSVDPTGKSNEMALQITTEDVEGYIWSNADHNVFNPNNLDGGGIAHLVDGVKGDEKNFFHTRYDGGDNTEYHYIEVDLGEGNKNTEYSFSYTTRTHSTTNVANKPKAITVMVSNEKDANFTTVHEISSGLPTDNNKDYTSAVYNTGEAYRYMRFKISGSGKFWHMAEFDLYKMTSSAEVAPLYKNLAGVTNEETATVYDSLVDALYVYNNGGTADEMQAAYNALKPLYENLKAKKDKIFNGVYNINYNGEPLFIAYAAANELKNLTGVGNAGFRLFDATIDNTTDNNKTVHQAAIGAQAAADALFTIVPKEDNSGYLLQAQGWYMRATGVHSQWDIQAFDTDVANAGTYLFEETADVFKLKSTINVHQNSAVTNYVNDWGPVFGCDDSNKKNLSTFTLTQVTEYTLNVPESGVTTLCLPFNVVLPAGVTAYDLAEANLTNAGSYHTYELVTIASEGETLAKNTPVIVKATTGDYVLTITMNDEDAKASTAGTLLRSGLVKTTIEAGSKYIYDGENFNRVTAATEIAANQCWMELGESKGDIIYGTAPAYVLTTDEENPVLYKIEIKRADDGSKVLQYDEASKLIAVADRADNKSYQAWYFTQGTADGQVFIHPYNADGNVIGATDTGNGAGKVSAAGKDAQEYDEWVIVARGNDSYYNIQATNDAYFSNNGGVQYKMGFWDGDANESKTQNDGGSLFKFVPLTFDNDNPRYYQLKDVAEYLGDGSALHTGTSVGLYDITDYTAAYTAASAIVTAGNKTAAADCHSAYTTLRSEYNNVSVNVASPDKIYYIKSVAAADGEWNYSTGKYVHTLSAATTRSDKTYNHSHLVFDAFNDITPKSLAAFQFEAVEGGYKIKNLHTGLYVKSFAAGAEHMGAAEDAVVVTVSAYADGQVTLQIGDNSPMHAEKDGNVIVQWRAVPGNASLWTIDEVAEISDLDYTITMPADGYTTLYLPYNVTLPKGVTAYTVDPAHILQKGDGTYYYDELTQVAAAGEKLAKGTAVIIKATAGEYTFEATFDDTDAKTAAASALVGTYYKQTVSTGYGMAVENNEPIFNRITADTAVEPNNCWLVADGITTDKIGTSVEFQSVEIEDGKVYRIRGRLSNGVLRTLYNNGANKKILWTGEAKDDASTIFIAQEGEDGKFKLVSALANGYWSQDAKIAEEGVELTFANGSVNGTAMIVGNNGRRFCVDGDDLDFYSNVAVEPANAYVNENVTTDFVFELVEDVTVGYTLRMAKNNAYATLYLPYAVTVPSGVTAYIAHSPTTSLMMLTDVKGVIPANTPVVIKRETTNVSEDYLFAYTTDAPAIDFASYTNRLKGYLIDTLVEGETGYNYYMLMRYNTVEAFYWILKEYDENGKLYTGLNQSTQKTHIKCIGNKAFFSTSTPNNSASYRFVFEGTTGIDGVDAEGNGTEAIYDLQGRKLQAAPEKGIYIVNGELIVK